jgi:hypothetical protein
MQLTATFIVEKETKNTVRYQETDGDQPPIMGTAYVQKWALKKLGNGTAPSRITITITVE